MEKVEISVIVPVYNEEENIMPMYEKVKKVLDGSFKSSEIIFVDDGSSDKTVEKLQEISGKDKCLKVVCLRKNFGQTAAMSAGFDYAEGEVVVTLDGDLQNDPEDIPFLVEKLKEGFDLVCGWRKERRDKALSRKLPSKIANWLISKTTGVKLNDYGCTLKAYTKDIAKNLELYGELHRFIPVLASIYGAKIVEVPVKHHPRIHGKSKYTISRTYRVLMDLLTITFLKFFSTKPLHIFGKYGVASLLIGLVIEIWLLIEKILGYPIGGRPLLLLGIVLILAGIQLLSLGVVAEIQVRTYYDGSRRKIYQVREIYGKKETS